MDRFKDGGLCEEGVIADFFRGSAEEDDEFGFQGDEFLFEMFLARFDLACFRRTVVWWSVFDDIGDVDICAF